MGQEAYNLAPTCLLVVDVHYIPRLIVNIPKQPPHFLLNVLMLLFKNHKLHVLVLLFYGVF